MIKSQWWLVFVLLGVNVTLGVEFENICTVSGKFYEICVQFVEHKVFRS